MKKSLFVLSLMATTALTANAWADDVNCYDYCTTAGNNCPTTGTGCLMRVQSGVGTVYYKLTDNAAGKQTMTVYGPSAADTGTSIPGYVFRDKTNKTTLFPDVSEINFSGNITSIGNSAFQYSNVTNLNLPNTLTTIGSYTFSQATNLTSLTIPDSVKTIGDGAFALTNNLASLTIPDSVTTIKDRAFTNTKLTTIIVPDSVTRIDDYAFNNTTGIDIHAVIIGENVKDLQSSSFYGINGPIFCPDTVPCAGHGTSFIQTYTKHDNGVYEIGGEFYASADEMSQKVTCIRYSPCTYQAGCGASADAQSCLQAVSDYRDNKAASMAGGALCGTEIECRNLLDMASKDSTYDCGTTGTSTNKSIAVCSQYAKDNSIDLAGLYERSATTTSNGSQNGSSTGSGKRIYTVEEARQAVEAAGTDTVNFRIRYK